MKRRLVVGLLTVAALCVGDVWRNQPVTRVAAQAVPGDADGDGVADGDDCAPADGRLAVPHTFYYDLDGDQSGRAADPIALCTPVPLPGLVAWSGDPDDQNNRVTAPRVARGNRLLGVDLSAPAANGDARLDLAREIGANATALTLHWSGMETTPGVFNGAQSAALTAAAPVYAAEQLALNLTISPIAQTYWTLPADLAAGIQNGSVRFNDPLVIARFNALLTHVHGQLSGVTLTGLQIGHELDLFLSVRSDIQFWADYTEFFLAVKAHAESLWGAQLHVGITSTWSGLLHAPAAGLMQHLNTFSDAVSLTYVPRTPTYQAIDPGQVKTDVQQIIAAYYPKVISVHSLGYPSSVRVGASATRQSQFVEAFFEVWDMYPELIRFASFIGLHDVSPGAAASDANAAHRAVPPASLTNAASFLGSLGLRTYASPGESKGGYHTLRNAAFNRGWWRVPTPATRPYLIGFTPALWSHTPETSIQDAVLQYNADVIASNGDLIAYHFDQGIPWPEAYADTFASPEPPYSANVREVWSKHRSSQPAGVKVAVAITPLGLPRHRMAAYWGVGQGFILDEHFNQIPNGPVIDYEGRILPAPWNTYALDSPQVKTAYLNYARRVIDYFKPTYLITGIEANLAVKEPAAFAQYVELQRYLYEQLRANPAYDNVKIVVSITAEEFVNDEYGRPILLDALMDSTLQPRNLQALEALEPYLDIVGLSLYPIKTLQGAYDVPAWYVDNLVAMLRTVTDKPIGITETGYPSTTFDIQTLHFPSTPEKQSRFLRLLLSDAAKHDGFEFIINWSVRDITAALDLLRERILATPGMNPVLAEFYKYFEFIGIYDASGNPKPAAAVFSEFFAKPLEDPEYFVPPVTLWSPGGALQAYVGVSPDGHLVYSVTRGTTSVIESSPIGIVVDGVDLGSSVTNISVGAWTEVNETYPTRGVHPRATNHYFEIPLEIRRSGAGDLTAQVIFRLYDDGVAYRYVIPGAGTRAVSGESSGWAFPYGTPFWYQTNTGNYESTYWNGTIGLVGDHIGGPLTLQLPDNGGYVVLTEAALLDYSGMTFEANLLSPMLRARFLDDSTWPVTGGEVTPWRALLVAPTLTDLVNSDFIANLNDAPDPALFPQGSETPWIKPGRAVWSWWSDFNSPANFDTQRRYVDDATRLRAEYVLVDAGWELGFPANGKDQFVRLSELVAYARTQQRYVGIWVWKNWTELLDPSARRAFLRAVSAAGAVGVKIDNIGALDSESFANVQLYETILREAAEEKLMVNFHGCNKATGLVRTYPNEITREGFMGLETNAYADQGKFAPPSHNAAVPFIRMAVGVGDYTPVTFTPAKLGTTTFAHQLALAGLFTSPVQHFGDDPALLLAQPLVQDVFRLLPTEWDETIVLPPSAIGDLALMARRQRNRWFLFGINGNAESPRSLPTLPLSFLGEGRYDAIVLSDATATSFHREERAGLTQADALNVQMLAGGGFVAILSPAAEPQRRVLQGFSSMPPSFTDTGWQKAYSAVLSHGDMISHTQQDAVPWVQALTSSNYRDYSSYLQAFWDLFRAADSGVVPHLPKYLMLNPIDPATYTGLAPQWDDQIVFTLPPPWNEYEFNHPNVKTAFLNYAIAAIETLRPTHLALNVEANILLAKAPHKWTAFKEFNAFVYTALKQRYPDLVVFSTIQYEHMLGLTEESRSLGIQLRHAYTNVLEAEVKSLLEHSDLVAISTYPFLIENNRYVRPDGRLDQDYYERAYALAATLGKPLAFEQTGYISRDLYVASRDVTVPGSDARQQLFVEHLLHDSHVENVSFLINFISHDYGTNYGTSAGSMTWAYTGLWNEDGTPKPALTNWELYRAEVANTGALSASTAAALGDNAPTPYESLAASMRLAATTATLAGDWESHAPPSPELFIRWQQFASFLPTFEVPPDDDPTAPWGFGEPYREAAIRTLARRAAFMSYLQPLFDAFATTGRFALTSLSTENEPPLLLLGDWVLLAPVVEEGAQVRTVGLPSGANWLDWHSGRLYSGGETITVDAPLDQIPLFIRMAQ
jgi:alpha-glucosidase